MIESPLKTIAQNVGKKEYIISVFCTEGFYVENDERYYGNDDVANFLRELLFFTMSEKGIRFN